MLLRKLSIIVIGVLFSCLILVGTTYSQYQVGQKVGDFSLKDLDGNIVKLSSFSNKVILLNFFATW